MSLNRCEQRLFDYLQVHREERQFWEEKVRAVAQMADARTAAARLDSEMWRYYEERSATVAPLQAAARREGLQRMSMKSLAELLLRLWLEPRPKK